jgi:hypothetical protein
LDKATVSEDTPDQRKKFRRKGRGLAYLGSSDSSGFGRRHLRSPARNLSVARRRFREGAKGDGGGECGLYIGTEGRRLRQGVRRNQGRRKCALLRGIVGERNGWRKETLTCPDAWDPHVSEIREK